MTPAELFAAATGHHRAGRLAEAEPAYRALLAQVPGHADASQLLALVLAQAGRLAEALPLAETAVTADPRRGDWLTNLGELYRQLNRPADAEATLRRAVVAAPQLPEAHYNLANVLKSAGHHDAAIAAYGEALHLRPNYHQAHYNLANTFREEGRLASAVRHYREALALRPDWSDAHLNLANALVDQKDHAGAADHYRRAAAGKPDDADLIDSLGHVYAAQGQPTDAADCYRRALALTPDDALRELRLAGVGPAIALDTAAADSDRAKLHAALDRLAGRRFDVAKLHSSGAEPPMRLAYQGRDDLALMRRWAEVVAAALPQVEPPPVNDGKPRIGVVVTRGHEGVFARCLGELVARLDPSVLDVRIVCGRSGANVLRHLMPGARLETFAVPERVDEAAAALRTARFDVLHFWEIGTDSLNTFLPFFRPARHVSATWGWPVSTGQLAVHDFVSADALEPPGAEAHYSERLVRLASLPTYYVRPPVPVNVRREVYGFDASTHVYLCQQNLRKLQPEFDATLADILRSDPAGVIVLIADEQPRITEMLRTRLTAAAPDVAGRVVIAPRQERAAYMGLVACADAILDPPHYGGGANTVYDAAAAGVPTVTLPGSLQRTRWAAAVNERLGVAAELNAADAGDYARRAVRLATDRDLRADVVRRIGAATSALFEDATAVRELQEYLLATAHP